MKAFRNIGGNVVEISVDTDPNGAPILPPDTTVDEKPIPNEGHYVTVVGNVWVQIPIPQEVFSFEYKKQQALAQLSKYKAWYSDQPVEHDGVKFDADEQARARLTQVLVINSANGYLPPAWIAADNSPYPISNITEFIALVNTVQTAFGSRFYEMDAIRQNVIAAADEEALALIEIPVIPNRV